MNYESATDFELNKRLLELTCHPDDTITDIYQHRLAGKLKLFSHAMFKVEGCDDELSVNYCTDWNATMPLAVEHGLDIELPTELLGGIGQITKHIECNTDIMVEFVIGDNPLRAIVICLIKVLENK